MADTQDLVRAYHTGWRWQAKLYDLLEEVARERLIVAARERAERERPEGKKELTAFDLGKIEDEIEQCITTEQTAWLVGFFWLLRKEGVATYEKMKDYIDRHNQSMRSHLRDMDEAQGQKTPFGRARKRRLLRVRQYGTFTPAAKEECARRFDERDGIMLSLIDVRRFMAYHMDGDTCKNRLDALVDIGLLKCEEGPNLKLLFLTEELEAIVTSAVCVLIEGITARE